MGGWVLTILGRSTTTSMAGRSGGEECGRGIITTAQPVLGSEELWQEHSNEGT